MSHETFSFEKAFARLEHILELMNAGKTPLEESLSLFEEAEHLIRTCTGRLNQAEQKIEMLIKSRTGELVLDSTQKPRIEPYQPQAASPTPQAAAYRPPAPPSKPAVASVEDLPF